MTAPTAHTPHLRPSHLAHIAALATRLGTELARPCSCGRERCTIGDHVLRALRDGQLGPRAQDFQPTPTGGSTSDGLPTAFAHDPEDRARAEFTTAALELQRQAETLLIVIANWAPDRKHADDTASDDQWCRHHLETIGKTQPLGTGGRGGLCGWCYTFKLRHKLLPPAALIQIHHERGKVNEKQVSEALAAHRAAQKRRRNGKGRSGQNRRHARS